MLRLIWKKEKEAEKEALLPKSPMHLHSAALKKGKKGEGGGVVDDDGDKGIKMETDCPQDDSGQNDASSNGNVVVSFRG